MLYFGLLFFLPPLSLFFLNIFLFSTPLSTYGQIPFANYDQSTSFSGLFRWV